MYPIRLLLFVAFCAFACGQSSAADDAPIVGAIRWDAWYGDGGVTKTVESSLGQPKYHFRLPWFARVVGEGKVRINGDSQTIVEQEIAYAAKAGLNYWAFLDYCDDSVTATPDELAAHIREALEWTKANRDINPSNAVIIYGWNEHDEGGWLQPTLGADGNPDEARINALGKVLRPK